MRKVEELQQEIQQLSREESAELRVWFWDQAVDDPDTSLDAERVREAEDRLAAYHSAGLAAVDADQVFDDLGRPTEDQNLLTLTREHRAELDRCLDAHEADGNPGRPAEEVIVEIKKRL